MRIRPTPRPTNESFGPVDAVYMTSGLVSKMSNVSERQSPSVWQTFLLVLKMSSLRILNRKLSLWNLKLKSINFFPLDASEIFSQRNLYVDTKGSG